MNGRTLTTTTAVIDALGGNQPVKEITDAASRQTVSNWRRFKAFPSNTHAVMKAALLVIGYDAPDSLWGQVGRKPKPVVRARPSRKRKRVPRSKGALREGAQSSV